VKWTSWLALGALTAFVAFVVYTTLGIGGVRCEVCVDFKGRQACRTVDGADEHETRSAAQTNACALLAAGVTETMACERTTPSRSDCH
jgi:hypothetical protein